MIGLLFVFFDTHHAGTWSDMESFSTKKNSKNKHVCIYAYYEKNEDYKHNFEFFLKNGGILPNVDYYIVINGSCTVDIPKADNIKVIRRQNQGFDFGAWQHVIKKQLSRPYDYYIFMNSSVIGPYSDTPWLDRFLELFQTGPDVKLVGTTINILEPEYTLFDRDLRTYYNNPGPFTHVQSMFFILNQEGFDYLNSLGFFNNEATLNQQTDIYYFILNKEIPMSQIILKHGWNINCILSKYRDKDYRKITKNFNPSFDDPYYSGAYFGNTITPEDVIFYKAYRVTEPIPYRALS